LSIDKGLFRGLPKVGAGLFALMAFASVAFAEDASPACRRIGFEGKRYLSCSIDVRLFEIRLVWRGEASAAFGSIAGFLRQLKAAEKSRLLFAMNAGMYEPDLRPVGLLIEHGSEQAPLNVRKDFGNFYWKPNGVFFVADGKVGILETSLFQKTRPAAEHATQSGPMLVRNGTVDGNVRASSSSKNIRNGVGVRDEHTAIFVISEDAVSFAEFARLFRDGLSCPDALYLDGTISRLYAPSLGRTDQEGVVGPIVAAFSRAALAPAK
jgi:uncharacterized protein YigE (DUF2233 family)